ncbi:hypothetical protein Hanom_Chr04g00319901 [Helianthus anomalus]
MELTSRKKMTRFQTFWIQIRKNKPLDKSHKTSQTLGTKMVKRVNYIVSPCGLHKVTYLGTNSLKSHSRVLTFYFVTFGGINVNCLLNYYYLSMLFCANHWD